MFDTDEPFRRNQPSLMSILAVEGYTDVGEKRNHDVSRK
jgi:hypothetical protein